MITNKSIDALEVLEYMAGEREELTYPNCTVAFTYFPEQNQKKWKRYVSKIKDKILNFYRNPTVSIKDNTLIGATKEILCSFCMIFFLEQTIKILTEDNDPLFNIDLIDPERILTCNTEEKQQKLYTKLLGGLLDLNACSLYLHRQSLTADFKENFVLYALGTNHLEEIINEVISKISREYIRFQKSNNEITEENFVLSAIPDDREIVHIVSELNAEIIDRIAILVSKDGLFDYDILCDKERITRLSEENTDLKEQYSELNKNIDDLQLQCKKQKEEIEKLQMTLLQKQSGELENKKLDAIIQENDQLRQKLNKLQKQYDCLYKKYHQLKHEYTNDNQQENDTEYELLREMSSFINYEEGRFLFIAHNRTGFQQKVRKIFPNAIFLTSVTEPFPDNVDLAIAITPHIGHKLYYYAKSQCKSKMIPLIHSPNTNADLILEEIEKIIKRNEQ